MTGLLFENKSTLVFAPTDSSIKQAYITSLIFQNDSTSMIIVDNEIEFLNETCKNVIKDGIFWVLSHEYKEDQGYKVAKLDFVDFKGWGFNPISFVKNDEDAQRLAHTISMNTLSDGKEDFFQERARTLLKNMIVHTKTNFSPENANFDSLISTYDKYISNEKIYMKWIEEQDQEDVGVQGLKSFFNSLTGKTRSSVTSSFDSIISLYRLEKIREMTKKSDFEFEDFVNNKYALYIKIASSINPYMGITSVFFTQMFDAFFTIARKSPISQLPIPVSFLLDQFSNIGVIKGYIETLTIGSKHLINLITIMEDLNQVKKGYGVEGFMTILTNHKDKMEFEDLECRMNKLELAQELLKHNSHSELIALLEKYISNLNSIEHNIYEFNDPDLEQLHNIISELEKRGHNLCGIQNPSSFLRALFVEDNNIF
ncbi:type IV secretory system conjugative DNA transfer family protein [Bacillus cereus group sp. BfR-BA-01441]|uniref:type IV secretory system conjugative DNA transfer family protein n=1 Tax=Bacillus cereus group sp. BfR-BA-01441 TaxID=2920348 RepID=UPI001F55B95B